MAGSGKGRVNRRLVANLHIDAEIGPGLIPDQGRIVIEGVGRHGDGGENIIINDNALRPVLCNGEGFPNHNSDRFADITRLVDGQVRLGHCKTVKIRVGGHNHVGAAVHGGLMIQWLAPITHEIGAGKHGDHAGQGVGRASVNGLDTGMGMG